MTDRKPPVGVTIQLAGPHERDLSPIEAEGLVRELQLLAHPAASDLVDRINGALTDRTRVVRLETDDEAAVLLRALDHLRNMSPTVGDDVTPRTLEDSGQRLRNDLINTGVQPLTYQLDSWELGTGSFHSYSGRYTTGARLVDNRGHARRVDEVIAEATGTDNGRLRVSAWRRAL